MPKCSENRRRLSFQRIFFAVLKIIHHMIFYINGFFFKSFQKSLSPDIFSCQDGQSGHDSSYPGPGSYEHDDARQGYGKADDYLDQAPGLIYGLNERGFFLLFNLHYIDLECSRIFPGQES